MSPEVSQRVKKTTELARAWVYAKTEKQKNKYATEILGLLNNTIINWVSKLPVDNKQDLIQEYRLKVLICLENYNPSLMSEFETYLYYFWKKAKNEHSAYSSTIKPPTHRKIITTRVEKCKVKKTTERDYNPIKVSSLNIKQENSFDKFKEERINNIQDVEPVPTMSYNEEEENQISENVIDKLIKKKLHNIYLLLFTCIM